MSTKKRRAWKWSDDMARNPPAEVDRLVRENIRLIKWFAYRFRWGLDWETGIEVATDGLIRAAQTFDPAVGVTFSFHAHQYMRGFRSHAMKRRAALKRGHQFEHVDLSNAQNASTPFVYPEEVA